MDYNDLFLSPNVAEDNAHHTRSRSFKGRPRPKEHEEHEFRPRRNSMPSHPHRRLLVPQTNNADECEEEPREALCRVRSFKTTSKGGIVNRGDSIKRKTQKENLHATKSLPVNREVRQDTGRKHSSCTEFELVQQTPKTQTEPLTVIVLGPAGVGKTLLATQFMTSEYIGTSSDGDGK